MDDRTESLRKLTKLNEELRALPFNHNEARRLIPAMLDLIVTALTAEEVEPSAEVEVEPSAGASPKASPKPPAKRRSKAR